MEGTQLEPIGNGPGDPVGASEGLSGAAGDSDTLPRSDDAVEEQKSTGAEDVWSPAASQPMAEVDPVPDVAERLRVATQTADALARLLHELEEHAGELDTKAQEALTRAQEMESGAAQVEAYRAALLQVAGGDVSSEDVSAMRDLSDALVRKPSDLLVMVKISEQAEKLAAIVRAHQQILDTLQSDTS